MNRLSQDNRETPETSNRGNQEVSLWDADPAELSRGRAMTAAIAKSHYENFLVASLLLPKRLKQPFYDVYAFCRTADDVADESPSPQIATERLAETQRQLDATFAGLPPTAPFVALADTIVRFQLPKQPFDDLMSAFRQDQETTRYAEFDQLLDYCCRSANPVGRIVLQMSGCCDDDSAALSDQICTGLQLANFWQDVKRDFEIGRVYLPADQMKRYGVTESDFILGAERNLTPVSLRDAINQQCELAEQFLRRGLPLINQVPSWLAADIRLFAHGGLATIEAIRRVDFDVLRVRPKVSKTQQVSMLARAWLGWL
ncbi:squalene synthase HpnC [Rubripirellula reticaptiva]|uniref:squalene synthase HpnC n=1 Tax=Rubripirellula reticaptiva TaxID=2528013 RepID=UPI001FE34B50|nr:squalene synthase HpnC [Rubripirellula reticaptiva]